MGQFGVRTLRRGRESRGGHWLGGGSTGLGKPKGEIQNLGRAGVETRERKGEDEEGRGKGGGGGASRAERRGGEVDKRPQRKRSAPSLGGAPPKLPSPAPPLPPSQLPPPPAPGLTPPPPVPPLPATQESRAGYARYFRFPFSVPSLRSSCGAHVPDPVVAMIRVQPEAQAKVSAAGSRKGSLGKHGAENLRT